LFSVLHVASFQKWSPSQYKQLFPSSELYASLSNAPQLATGVQILARAMMAFFFLATAPRPTLGPTQPPIQWIPWSPSPGINRPGGEVDDAPPSSAEVKNAWSYTSSPPVRLHYVKLS